MLQVADVLNLFDPVAVQIQNIQFIKAVQILHTLNLVFAKHEDLSFCVAMDYQAGFRPESAKTDRELD